MAAETLAQFGEFKGYRPWNLPMVLADDIHGSKYVVGTCNGFNCILEVAQAAGVNTIQQNLPFNKAFTSAIELVYGTDQNGQPLKYTAYFLASLDCKECRLSKQKTTLVCKGNVPEDAAKRAGEQAARLIPAKQVAGFKELYIKENK